MPTSLLRRFRYPLQATALLAAFFVLSIFLPPVNLFADARDYLPLHSGLEIFSIVVAWLAASCWSRVASWACNVNRSAHD